MGCSASKNGLQLPIINYIFTTTNNNDFDDYFKRASKLLQMMETLRQRIVVTKEKFTALAGTKHLHGGDSYTKAIEVLFCAISAANQGYLHRANIEVGTKLPFFTLNTIGFCKETLELVQTLKDYLLILSETNDSLQTAIWQLQQLKEEQIEKKKDIDPKMNSKTKNIIESNMKRLTDGINTSAKVLSQVPDEQKNAKELLNYMQGLFNYADEVGAKVHAVGLLKPIEIYKWIETEKKKEERRAKGPAAAKKANEGTESLIKNDSKMLPPALKNSEKKDASSTQTPDKVPKRVEFDDNKFRQEIIEDVDIIDDKKFEHQGSIHGHNNALFDDPTEVGTNNFGATQASQGNGNQANNSQSPDANAQKYLFVGEKSLEAAIKENQVDEHLNIKSSGGYLSPGGKKQATILQANEDVIDDDDEHGFANNSDTLKKFIEKAQSYLGTKDQ